MGLTASAKNNRRVLHRIVTANRHFRDTLLMSRNGTTTLGERLNPTWVGTCCAGEGVKNNRDSHESSRASRSKRKFTRNSLGRPNATTKIFEACQLATASTLARTKALISAAVRLWELKRRI